MRVINNTIYDDDGKTDCIKMGWDNNVKNCHVPVERSIMISDDQYRCSYQILDAGIILGELELSDKAGMHFCGKWYWLEFKNEEDAMAFKLRWVN